jgi:hypothetical protein
MPHLYHMTRASGNKKTGPIPVTTSSSGTCPKRCSLKGNGCYAESGPLALHWRAVGDGRRGQSLDELCGQIRKLPKYQLWRWAQAGDLPGDGHAIDAVALEQLTAANKGRNGFGYTHYDPRLPENAAALAQANEGGFTISVSAETLAQADEFAALGVAPVVVILPAGASKSMLTPAGRHVTVCPASIRDDVQCASCGICQEAGRKAIIGFPAHGTGAKKAQAVFFASKPL